jgi:hypothetical protein
MKKVKQNAPKIRRWLRCINRDTKDFIDVPFAGGQGGEERKRAFDNAYIWTWSYMSNYGESKPEYHYWCLYSLNKEGTGFYQNERPCMSLYIPFTPSLFKNYADNMLDPDNNVPKTDDIKFFQSKISSQVKIIDGIMHYMVIVGVDLKTNEIVVSDEIQEYLDELEVKSIYDLITPETIF